MCRNYEKQLQKLQAKNEELSEETSILSKKVKDEQVHGKLLIALNYHCHHLHILNLFRLKKGGNTSSELTDTIRNNQLNVQFQAFNSFHYFIKGSYGCG